MSSEGGMMMFAIVALIAFGVGLYFFMNREQAETTEAVEISSNIRLDIPKNNFDENKFKTGLATQLGIKKDQITIHSVTEGSAIVNYSVYVENEPTIVDYTIKVIETISEIIEDVPILSSTAESKGVASDKKVQKTEQTVLHKTVDSIDPTYRIGGEQETVDDTTDDTTDDTKDNTTDDTKDNTTDDTKDNTTDDTKDNTTDDTKDDTTDDTKDNTTDDTKDETTPTPIDGQFSAWEVGTYCPAPYEDRAHTWTRTCTPPQHGGAECNSTDGYGTALTRTDPCPVDCNWTYDMNIDCVQSETDQFFYRKIKILNRPEHGGAACPSSEISTLQCAPVQGGFSDWTTSQMCAAPYEQNVHTETRTCTNPAPKYGGENCSGETTKTTPCPMDGYWTEWTTKEEDLCPETNEDGSTAYSKRYRDYYFARYGGQDIDEMKETAGAIDQALSDNPYGAYIQAITESDQTPCPVSYTTINEDVAWSGICVDDYTLCDFHEDIPKDKCKEMCSQRNDVSTDDYCTGYTYNKLLEPSDNSTYDECILYSKVNENRVHTCYESLPGTSYNPGDYSSLFRSACVDKPEYWGDIEFSEMVTQLKTPCMDPNNGICVYSSNTTY